MKNKRGFLYYAHNNEEVNYLRLAICSALSGKYHLKDFNATVVTDSYSLKAMTPNDNQLLNKYFENVIVNDKFFNKKNFRKVRDVYDDKGMQPWYNGTRPNAFNDSPYDETFLVDVDFIFQDSNLNKIWNSDTSIKISKNVIPIVEKEIAQKTGFSADENIGTFSIPMYWATLVYFKKDDYSKTFFDLVDYIQENYFYFRKLYQAEDATYRNDYSFSIALHILNGNRVPSPEYDIPYKFILTTTMDSVYRINKSSTKFIIHSRDWKSPWHLLDISNISYHCLNKLSLLNKYDQFVGEYHV